MTRTLTRHLFGALAGSALACLSVAAQAHVQQDDGSAAASAAASTAPAGDAAPLDESQAATLKPGHYLWHPDAAPDGPVRIAVDLDQQVAYVYRDGTLIGISTVSSGRDGHLTPIGSFTILQKEVKHFSKKYDDAPMPYMERLTWDGVALHAGGVPGFRESHGCIHLPAAFAKALYGITRLGAKVEIIGTPPEEADGLDDSTIAANDLSDPAAAVSPSP